MIHNRLSRLPTGPSTYSMIHADLHPRNLVVNGERLHIIDFDDAGFGWHMYELAVGVFDFRDHPLVAETAALLPLFLLVRTLALIGWFADRPEVAKPSAARPLVERAIRLSAEFNL